MPLPLRNCGNGANLDLPPSELTPGVWSGGRNVTFANGVAEKRNGFKEDYTTPAVIPYAALTYITSTARFLVQAGVAKVYVDDGSTQTEITRYTDGKVISSITNVTTTATLTTATAHGLSTNDAVTVFGASPSAYNGTFVITVSSATVFTYTMLSDPGGNATTVGQYSYDVVSDFTGGVDDRWSLFAFNGVLIANNPVDGPYYWNGDTGTRLRRLTGWPSGQLAYSMQAFKKFLIALAPTISSVFQPHTVLWSVSAEPGAIPTTWAAASTNDAGDSPETAEAGGHLIDGKTQGNTFFIYKQDARFAADYAGGNDVLRIYGLPGEDGILARGCAVKTPVGQVFLSNGDVMLHNGGDAASIAEGQVRKYLFSTMDSTNVARSFLCLNPQQKEVWVCFPSNGAASCDMALAWNWSDKKWSLPFTLPNVTCGTSGLISSGLAGSWAADSETWAQDVTTWDQDPYASNQSRLIVATTAPKIGLANTGSLDFGESIDWYAEMRGVSFGDTDHMKVARGVRPLLRAVAGTQVLMKLAATKGPDDDPVYTGSSTFTQGTTNWANQMTPAGRYLAIRIEGLDDQAVSFRSFDMDLGESKARF